MAFVASCCSDTTGDMGKSTQQLPLSQRGISVVSFILVDNSLYKWHGQRSVTPFTKGACHIWTPFRQDPAFPKEKSLLYVLKK